MSDNVEASAVVGAGGPTFASLNDAGGVAHPATVLQYPTAISPGANTFADVQLTNGLPVQPQTGATWAITASALPLPAGAAADGVDGTGITAPTGGSGIRGWLSGIYKFVAAMFGTAGTAATAVVTVQGIASMTAVKVDGSGVTQPVSGTFWQATQPVSLASLPALASGANVIGAVTQSGTWNVGTVTTVSTVTAVTAITNALPAGTNSIGIVQPGNTPNTSPWLVSDRPATSGGLSTFRRLSTADVNAANVKNAAGQVFGIFVSNTNASPRWLKLYDKATAPTVGTDTPKLTLLIPGNASGGGVSIQQGKGISFASGIGIGLTTGIADNDTGAVAANDLAINLLYA